MTTHDNDDSFFGIAVSDSGTDSHEQHRKKKEHTPFFAEGVFRRNQIPVVCVSIKKITNERYNSTLVVVRS